MKMKLYPTLLVLVAPFLLSACQPKTESEAGGQTSINKSEAVAIVNGTLISKTAFEELKNDVQQRTGGQTFPTEQLLDELIKRELLLQEANVKKLAGTPEVKANIAKLRKSILTQAAIQDYLKSNVISDEDLKAEYDGKFGGGQTEYKARHILVQTEEEAKALIDKLNKGGDFIALAKEKSTGPSANNGGDLGWFTPQQMVPPFSEAVIALENGKYTSEPVQTNFGWHVILREDSRELKGPDFDAVKEQIRPMLQRQKLQEYLDNLRANAKIEILLKDKPADPPASKDASAAADETEPAEQDQESEVSSETEQAENADAAASEQSSKASDEEPVKQ